MVGEKVRDVVVGNLATKGTNKTIAQEIEDVVSGTARNADKSVGPRIEKVIGA